MVARLSALITIVLSTIVVSITEQPELMLGASMALGMGLLIIAHPKRI